MMLPLLKKFIKSYEDLYNHRHSLRFTRPYKGVDLSEILDFEVGMDAALKKLNDACYEHAKTLAADSNSTVPKRSDVYPTYDSLPLELRKNTFSIYYNELKHNPTISEQRQNEILEGIVKIGQDQEFRQLTAYGKYHRESPKHNTVDQHRSYIGLFLKCIREIILFIPRMCVTGLHSVVTLSFKSHMCNPLNTASRNKINNLTKVVAELTQEQPTLSNQVGKTF